jgi:hypothetical protein
MAKFFGVPPQYEILDSQKCGINGAKIFQILLGVWISNLVIAHMQEPDGNEDMMWIRICLTEAVIMFATNRYAENLKHKSD